MGPLTLTPFLMMVACLCTPFFADAQGQLPTDLNCYACTFQMSGQATIGKFCGDPFIGAASANVTCDTSCMIITTKGGTERTQRGCYSDIGVAGACESYSGREVPGSNPPQFESQMCCRESFCNHGIRESGRSGLVVATLLCALVTVWTG